MKRAASASSHRVAEGQASRGRSGPWRCPFSHWLAHGVYALDWVCVTHTTWEFRVWNIILRYGPSSEWEVLSSLSVCRMSPIIFLYPETTGLTNDFYLELAKVNGLRHNPSQDHPHSWCQLQVWGVPKNTPKFDNFLEGLIKFTESYYANHYAL